MRNLWDVLRCKLGTHRWETIRVGTDRGKECRNCNDRIFDTPSSDDVRHVAETLGGMGGMTGGGG